MNLKTKFRIFTLIYFCFTLFFCFMIFMTLDVVSEDSRKNRLANSLIRDVSDLSSLINDYLLTGRERVIDQWRTKHKDLAVKIAEAQMIFKKTENLEVLNIVGEDLSDMVSVFDDLLKHDQRAEAGVSHPQREEFRKYLVQRLLSDSRRMISNGSRLEHLKYVDILGIQRETQEILFALIVILFVLITASIFLVFKSIEKRVRMLQQGARMIGGGNLDYRIGLSAKDEIGEVSRGFDEMTERLKKSREEVLLNEARLEALLKLNQMGDAPLREIMDFALEEAVRLTKSRIGYLAFMNEDETVMTMHAWSKTAMTECAIPNKQMVCRISDLGLLAEPVRQRKPVVDNDYRAPGPLKKGCPEGHVPISRYLSVPIFESDRIVVLAAAGNKEEAYDENDVRQLTLLMQGMWRLIQRKKSAEALRREKEFVRALLENMADGVVACDTEGLLVLFNRAARDWHGLDPMQIPQEEWASHYDLYCRDGVTPMSIQTVPLSRAFRGETVMNELMAIRAKNQPLRFVVANASPFFDAQGQKLGAVTVMRDVTESLRIEKSLRESEENFRAMAENANDGILVVTESLNISYLNNRTAELMGSSQGDVATFRLEELFHPEDFRQIQSHLTGIFDRKSKQLYCQSFLVKKDGSKIPVEMTGAETVWHSEKAVIMVLRDITERKKAEEFKNEVVRNVSHELRTPLHSMREGVTVLLDGLVGEMSEEQRGVLSTTRANLDRLARLVNSFLDFQRLEAGLLKFDRRLQTINDLVLEAVEAIRPSARNKNLQIETVLDGNLRSVEVDGDRILQVLVNLLNNAVKFTERGGVTVSTSMREGRVCVAVKDTGIGMKQDEFPKLFKQFVQLDSGKQFSSTGTGLGLAISRSIIELHSGKIWAESRYGEGSTFFFSLPAAGPS